MNFDRPKNISFLDFAGGTQLLQGENTKTVLPVILIGLSVTGVFGNLLVLLIFIRDFRNGRGSEVKALLATLSLTDLLILLLCVPVRALTYYRHTWTLGSFICRTADWFQQSCLVAKMLILAMSSRAGHNFISNTSECVCFGTTKMCGALVFVWITAMLLPIPQMIFASLQPYDDINVCVYEMPVCASDFMNVFYKIYPAAAFVVPIIFTLAYYTRALRNAEPKANHAPTPQQQTKVIHVLLCVSGANALMLLPEWVVWTWTRLGHNRPPVAFVIFAQVFLYACSSLCPVIFLTLFDNVRQGLDAVWFIVTCRGSRHVALSRDTKVEGNGSEMGPAVIHPQVALKCASLSARSEIGEEAGNMFPDLEHFWTERRNMAVDKSHDDPIPWEE